MGKITEIKLVGQPIFKQIMNLVEKVDINGLIRKHESDYYYKSFKTRTHLFTMLFGILSRCDSMTEVCEGLRAMGGKLNHLGMDRAPAKSTACDGLRNRNSEFFEDLYFRLVSHYKSFLSDSRTYGLTFKEVLIIDSTTIRLFSDVLRGVGRNPKGDGKKKGGMKVHMLIDAVQSVGRFIKMTEAKVHDKNFLKSLDLISHSMIVFDKAYNYYLQFALWTQKNIYFVTRIKKNAVYTVVEVKRSHYRKKGQAKVLRDEIIELEYHPEREDGARDMKTKLKIKLRKVCYQDEKNRYFEFLTNNFDISAEDVAFLYRKRWGIEILFKKMKQNFQLHYFYGENENAIYTQVWCTLIAQLLLTVTQKIAQAKKAFSVVASLVRIHLISMLDVNELLRSTKRSFKSKSIPPGLQLSFNM
ncbi:MAG: Transposase DDE domain protein [Bacteroidetes bacterium ADurb.Bin145]|nr:MAG: Transposase DDE domain protein [Bacteroidetes bacterium ADurb.Bin145]